MAKFVLTAQIKLQAPTNTQQVADKIKQQLKCITVDVNVKVTPQAQSQLAKLNIV